MGKSLICALLVCLRPSKIATIDNVLATSWQQAKSTLPLHAAVRRPCARDLLVVDDLLDGRDRDAGRDTSEDGDADAFISQLL